MALGARCRNSINFIIKIERSETTILGILVHFRHLGILPVYAGQVNANPPLKTDPHP